jgi:hypothetical protein
LCYRDATISLLSIGASFKPYSHWFTKIIISARVCLTTVVSRIGKIAIAVVANVHVVFTFNIKKKALTD